jgi:biopolymer transport protein ExbD
MMKMSKRALRMQKHQARQKDGGLNLVSLMDVFTILVFFLLISSSTVQQLPSTKDIKLPTSTASKLPEETLVIMVTNKDILVQGRRIADTSQVLAAQEDTIGDLADELKFQSRKVRLTAQDRSKGMAVTIMGDEKISYALLRKILATCRQANYTRIAFAASQTSKRKA